jgi:hypothetical protein
VLKDKGQQPISNALSWSVPTWSWPGWRACNTAVPANRHGEALRDARRVLATLRLADPGDWRITVTAGHSTAEFKITALPPQPKNSAATRPSTAPASQRLGADEGQVATAQGKQVTKGHDDGHGAAREAAGPNYYFVGSTLGVVLITIAMVPILRRRSSRVHRGEAA